MNTCKLGMLDILAEQADLFFAVVDRLCSSTMFGYSFAILTGSVMTLSRRNFLGTASVASTVAFSGFMSEMRPTALAASEAGGTDHTARILFNENPLGPSPKALGVLASAGQQFARYPLLESKRLAMKLRQYNGLPYKEVGEQLSLGGDGETAGEVDLILGVGSSEVLRAAAWAFCASGGNVVEPYPSYSAVGSAAAGIPGVNVQRKMVALDDHDRLDVAAMCAAIDPDTRLVVICNPNNPTGTTITVSDIERIAKATPSDALIFVDEAYIEFTEDPESASALEFAKNCSNVLVSRTFSKIHGLAGLRVGYGIADSGVIRRLKRYMLGGLSFNMPGILAAQQAIDDDEHLRDTLELNRSIHASWSKFFHDVGWKMTPSVTCFSWVNLGHDSRPLVRFLADRKVLVSGGQRWNMPDYVRISIGTEEENEMLLSGVRAFLAV